MTKVVRLETARSRKLGGVPPLSARDMIRELADIRKAAVLIENDLALLKQRLLEDSSRSREDHADG